MPDRGAMVEDIIECLGRCGGLSVVGGLVDCGRRIDPAADPPAVPPRRGLRRMTRSAGAGGWQVVVDRRHPSVNRRRLLLLVDHGERCRRASFLLGHPGQSITGRNQRRRRIPQSSKITLSGRRGRVPLWVHGPGPGAASCGSAKRLVSAARTVKPISPDRDDTLSRRADGTWISRGAQVDRRQECRDLYGRAPAALMTEHAVEQPVVIGRQACGRCGRAAGGSLSAGTRLRGTTVTVCGSGVPTRAIAAAGGSPRSTAVSAAQTRRRPRPTGVRTGRGDHPSRSTAPAPA